MMTCMLFSACSTQPELKNQNRLTKPKKKGNADLLYEAIVMETQSRNWKVEASSAKFRVVSTVFEPISKRVRKRRIMRVVVLPRGGALRVLVEYQRNVGPEDQAQWVTVEDASVRKKAGQEELEIARSIEQRFHRIR